MRSKEKDHEGVIKLDFVDQLKQFSRRVDKLKDQIETEEATKTSIIMPFFQLLGYNVFDPEEFLPEYTADVGIKKGEKVDYAIMKDRQPVILIEAKWCGQKLEKHDSQLFRYFATTPAKFAILTNGLIYKFYTDIDEQNKMDEKPFLVLNILDIKDSNVPELKKFHKDTFDVDKIFDIASELKYSTEIINFMKQQMLSPSDNFTKYILKEIYSGIRTKNAVEKFRDVVKKSLNQFVNELMSEKIKSALKSTEDKDTDQPANEIVEEVEQPRIITTEEELEGFFIIKNMLRNIVDPKRLSHKDTMNYFNILYDDNIRNWICRLYFGTSQKYIVIPDEQKNQNKYLINEVEDILKHKDKIIDAVKRYK